jgi:hypothetical protein
VVHGWLYDTVKQILKALNYRMFKEKLDIEKYFEKLDNRNIITLCRFRTTNDKLPIETGMWQNIARENRNSRYSECRINNLHFHTRNCRYSECRINHLHFYTRNSRYSECRINLLHFYTRNSRYSECRINH